MRLVRVWFFVSVALVVMPGLAAAQGKTGGGQTSCQSYCAANAQLYCFLAPGENCFEKGYDACSGAEGCDQGNTNGQDGGTGDGGTGNSNGQSNQSADDEEDFYLWLWSGHR